MASKDHWETVYQTKAPDAVSWYRPHLDKSLELIAATGKGTQASVIDIGGGEATLVDDLLAQGYRDISVLDISATALEVARNRLTDKGSLVEWIAADITKAELPTARYDLWHDRAVFHFLTAQEQRRAYVQLLERALRSDGQLIIATFGPQGPEKCSGLAIQRYDASGLAAELGSRFQLLDTAVEYHRTPFGTQQQFTWCRFGFRGPSADS